MTLKWKYFLSKRRMTPSSFVEARKLTSYESLVAHLAALNIEPPAFDEVAHLFRKNLPSMPSTPLTESVASTDELPAHVNDAELVDSFPAAVDVPARDDAAAVPAVSAQEEAPEEAQSAKKNKKSKSSQNRRYVVSSNITEAADEQSDND